MKDIPQYDTFRKVEYIKKGMSGDDKYYIESFDGKNMLLRLADISMYNQKRLEYEVVKDLYYKGRFVPEPIDFGMCNDKKSVFTLLSWIDGDTVEKILPKISKDEQYRIGYVSGENLRHIHAGKVRTIKGDWYDRYYAVINPRLEAYLNEGIDFAGAHLILDYLESNKYLLKERVQTQHHGDYHMGNMICSNDGSVYVIDWHTVDFDGYGDPWYEFNRLGVDYPAFASGQIAGYFNNEIPEDFWKLLAFYLSASAITSIVWAKYYSPESLEWVLNLNKNILRWFDNMKNPVPTWYLG